MKDLDVYCGTGYGIWTELDHDCRAEGKSLLLSVFSCGN